LAVEAGKASGTFTLDASSSTLAYASCYEGEDLYDSSRKNTFVVLTDAALGDTSASDDWTLAQRAKSGDLVVLTVRLDGAKLVNVRVNHKGVDGTIVLPGQWFTYRPAKAAAGLAAGSLTLAKRDFDGHAYSCSVEFVAAAAAAPAAEAAPEAAAPEPAEQPAAQPPATTSSIDPKSMTALLVSAMMQKDEEQALKLVKLGADPNGKDPYGVPVLSWAVMVCMPRVVQALVDAKADLKYERAPGLTVLMEAGACPEAEKILRAAGAK
jgi:hypothetical protein